jgi:hypothetical protein
MDMGHGTWDMDWTLARDDLSTLRLRVFSQLMLSLILQLSQR